MTTRANQGKSVVVVVEVVVVEVVVVVVVVVNGDGKVDWGLSNNSHSTWGGGLSHGRTSNGKVEWESRMGTTVKVEWESRLTKKQRVYAKKCLRT